MTRSSYRCGGSAGWAEGAGEDMHRLAPGAVLLPVELQCVNHTASTNDQDSTQPSFSNPTMFWSWQSNPALTSS